MSPKYSGPSAPALHAAKILLKNFEIVERPEGRIRATEKNIAILIDVCTDIFRVESVMDQLIKTTPWLDKDALARNLGQLRDAVRAVELVRNHMPRFANSDQQVPFSTGKGIEQVVSQEVQEHIKTVSRELSKVRTMEEERRVLKAAGIVR